ncbi:hypothetical protein ACHAXS_011463 [Conticribra weissflogii]
MTQKNNNGRVCCQGKAYGFEKKLQVVSAYFDALRINNDSRPNIKSLSESLGVSRKFVRKIEEELITHGRVLQPSEILTNRDCPRGPGANTMDHLDQFVLLRLYLEEPSRSLSSYKQWLFYFTGTEISTSTISRFFLDSFPIKAGFRRPNLVPVDKFRPQNLQKAVEYVKVVSTLCPVRVKFGDEKSLKGADLFNRLVRRNPLTGEIPNITTNPDFRNTYAITGFCGINRNTNPMWFRIHNGTNTAEEFAKDIETAILMKFLLPGDILVLDNAPNHVGKENKVLEDWLWERFAIIILWLPTRAPEFNPIELVWNTMVQRMQAIPLHVLKSVNRDCVAYAAAMVLEKMSHDDIESFYKSCYPNWIN